MNAGFDIRALRADYGDGRAEAMSCRSAAALFDFSFMSRIRIEGPGANELIATLTPRRIDDLTPGRIRYALRVAADGRVVGDLTIWRLDAESFEIFSGSSECARALCRGSSHAASILAIFFACADEHCRSSLPYRTPRLHRRTGLRNCPAARRA